MGTYCYITGGSDLIKIKDNLPEAIKDKVVFVGSACLGCDEEKETSKPPYAKVGDVLITECTEDKLLNEIYSQLGIER
ncbi:MAG: hypothetical protein KA273_00425 [Bacteroidales bacterium]|nr:hypothetical protein [Bacteroidales bacterium]